MGFSVSLLNTILLCGYSSIPLLIGMWEASGLGLLQMVQLWAYIIALTYLS